MWTAALHYLFPPRCALCGTFVESEDQTPICDACDPIGRLPPNARLLWEGRPADSTLCLRCGEPLSEGQGDPGICPRCLLYPLPCREFRSLWRYSPSIEPLIKRLKYRHHRELVPYLGACLATAALSRPVDGGFTWKRWDLIAALPSSARTLRRRGFSHTALLARSMSRFLGVYEAPLALLPRGNRALQTSLGIDERLTNMHGKFQASAAIPGKSVLLIDDVVTTGASIAAGVQACLDAGALAVDVLTLARSEHFHRTRQALHRTRRSLRRSAA